MDAAPHIAQHCMALRARMLDRALTRIYSDALRAFDVTPPQLNLLVAILYQPDMNPTELGRLLWLEKSTVSRNLKLLERDGRIQIKRAGRTQSLRATSAGKVLLNAALPAWTGAQEEARALIGEDGEQALRTIANRLSTPL